MKEKQSRKATKPSIEEEPVKKKKVAGKGISVQQKGNAIEKEFRIWNVCVCIEHFKMI